MPNRTPDKRRPLRADPNFDIDAIVAQVLDNRQRLRDKIERFDGRGQGDTLKFAGKRHQAIYRRNQVCAALAVNHSMNFIQDNCPYPRQKGKGVDGSQQDV